ncbi:MAG TPA: biopolymer transporter ExbD [Saprospiraceae bacterium]|nr:biopolymer transporter ExbD [Saprospiraceae bacterium]HUN16924.1 biopolymer transporter ExbD [Saprospiraceae bacterium]
MPKVKVPRKSTAIDMTAMCDVAFLLLTFFILTTKFRPSELAPIDIPNSTAQIPIPDKDIMMFQIAPDGKLFFGLDDQPTRLKLLDRLSSQYQLALSDKQKDAFRTLESWGMDIRQLPAFLEMDPNERAHFQHPGLKIDTTGGEAQIEDLILFSRQENNNLRIAIKGDKSTQYKSFDKLIQALQNRKVNKFNIITSARLAKE